VNIEAKQAELPTVAFDCGALPELIHHRKEGWICSEVSAESLAEGIAYFADDESRRREAGQQAKQSLARYCPDRFRREWRRMFDITTSNTSTNPH
jgi:glycosyltransferase involved in cell wall biosynthesis